MSRNFPLEARPHSFVKQYQGTPSGLGEHSLISKSPIIYYTTRAHRVKTEGGTVRGGWIGVPEGKPARTAPIVEKRSVVDLIAACLEMKGNLQQALHLSLEGKKSNSATFLLGTS